MILSNDTKAGPKNKPPAKEGERTKATALFNKNTQVPAALRSQILNATVHVDWSANKGIGSGVILNADPNSNKAYILTAKHLLHIFADVKPAAKKPADIVTSDFVGKLQIHYAPAALPGVAPSTAAVSAIDFTGSDDQTWDYDIMVLEVDDAAFHTHVTTHRFLPADVTTTYRPLLKARNTGDCDLLDKTKFIFFQMGYGSGRDKDIKATKDYDDLRGQVQCRWTEPKAKAPLAEAFDVDNTALTVSINTNLVELTADNTNSTNVGDSGGPLFALPFRAADRTTFYLIGVTTGGNYLSEARYRDDPASAPGNERYFNNVSTYWDTFCYAWPW